MTFDSEATATEALDHLPNSWLQQYVPGMRASDLFRGKKRFFVTKAEVRRQRSVCGRFSCRTVVLLWKHCVQK